MSRGTPLGLIEPQSFSEGVDRFLKSVRPYRRLESSFPVGLDATDTRRDGDEDLHQWFVRLMDKYCGGDPTRVAVEENLAVMAKLGWHRQGQEERLRFACIPVLIAECGLEEYYLAPEAKAVCVRLDLNYEALGEPFSHPLPHIHLTDADSPRFSLDGGTSGNIVADFLEFIYRNHVPGKWFVWARRQWLLRRGEQGEEAAAQFDQIARAFRDGQFAFLRANAHIISQIKHVLREAKDLLFKTHMDSADREILEYPSAR